MPIVEIEAIGELTGDRGQHVRALADALGDLFGSRPGETWVSLRSLPSENYAENRTSEPLGARAVFVRVTRRVLPSNAELKREAAEVSRVVAGLLHRNPEQTHVYYQPGAGRLAFGGVLQE